MLIATFRAAILAMVAAATIALVPRPALAQPVPPTQGQYLRAFEYREDLRAVHRQEIQVRAAMRHACPDVVADI